MPSPRPYELNLKSSQFPFLTHLLERTSITQEIGTPEQDVKPQPLYLKNVVPSLQGYDSLDQLGIDTSIGATDIGGLGNHFDKVWPFRDENGQQLLFSPAGGRSAVLKEGETAWNSYTNLGGNPIASRAYRKQLTYFCYAGSAVYRYKATGPVFQSIALTGLTIGNILGICSAASYMLAFDLDTIYYTNRDEAENAIDFTPLLGTAGSFKVLHLIGKIVSILPITNGFIVYGEENAVAGLYSGNPENPFTLREIRASSGIKNTEQVSYSSNVGAHFAWTRSGLQQLSPQSAENGFPQLTEFLRAQTLEVFNNATGTITKTIYDAPFAVKLELLGHRFLCISYGPVSAAPQIYTECLIYDLELQRWGKIVEDHVAIFQYTFAGQITYLTFNDLAAVTFNALAGTTFLELFNQVGTSPALQYRIGLCKPNGDLIIYDRANLVAPAASSNALILLGRLAPYKVGVTKTSEVEVESGQLTATIYTSLSNDPFAIDRKTVMREFSRKAGAKAQRFLGQSTGYHHLFALEGRFHLTTGIIKLSAEGSR